MLDKENTLNNQEGLEGGGEGTSVMSPSHRAPETIKLLFRVTKDSSPVSPASPSLSCCFDAILRCFVCGHFVQFYFCEIYIPYWAQLFYFCLFFFTRPYLSSFHLFLYIYILYWVHLHYFCLFFH